MEKIILKVAKREVVGKKLRKIRKEGLVPAVLYGHGVKNENLSVNYLDLKRVYGKAGENAIIEIEVDGKKIPVLICDTQMDPMNGNFSHVDFLQVNMKETVEAEIPLEFIGESVAVKANGGILVKNMDKIEVKCLPADLPSKFEVDLSKLVTFDDQITIGDIKTLAGVEIFGDKEAVIVLVARPRSEEEMARLDEKVEADVTKVEGVVKEVPATEGEKKEKK